MKIFITNILVIFLIATSFTVYSKTSSTDSQTASVNDVKLWRNWVQEMKQNHRGPFSRIRWFCNDGVILPPKSFACVPHGGGVQHGEWSDRTKQIRNAGFPIANVFVALEPEAILNGDKNNLLQQILLEQFLIAFDDGWILKKARFYRGAFQVEDEERKVTEILNLLVSNKTWLDAKFPLLFEASRLLPHGRPGVNLTELRGLATSLHEADPQFGTLRNKIHGKPDALDAERVREYASVQGKAKLHDKYENLAQQIEFATNKKNIITVLNSVSTTLKNAQLKTLLNEKINTLNSNNQAMLLDSYGEILITLREGINNESNASAKLAILDTMVALEAEVFTTTQSLSIKDTSRRTRIAWLQSCTDGLYASGLLTNFEWQQLGKKFTLLTKQESLSLADYREHLKYLSRVPVWANQRLLFHFTKGLENFSQLEPLVEHYIPDRLRGSPLLFYAKVLDSLNEDADRLSGIEHQLFGQQVATGLRGLNPGLSRGVLRILDDLQDVQHDIKNSILIVPETLADLAPVAGILTAHEGNHLSHVQLLARNLGIPNVVVGDALLPLVETQRGKRVVVAASPAGVINIDFDSPKYEVYFQQAEQAPKTQIIVNLEKLKLSHTDMIPTARLRATDSGVTVGPKAAQVGELTYHYPDSVSPGLAIPFGAFRQILDQPLAGDSNGELSAFEWMRTQYQVLDSLKDQPQQQAAFRTKFLQTLRSHIRNAELPPEFMNNLRTSMQSTFGDDGTFGVFVRSDTNVEDLPGFTGAGLNLTVPNVVGFENIVRSIKEVWASPFTERAFGWRQALMDKPEHVYAAVLLHKSVNSDKSGVLVSVDVETGSRDAATVVINEGVGGGVEGQSAETMRIDLHSAELTLRSSATAAEKRILLQQGDSKLVAALGPERLLTQRNVESLLAFINELPKWFAKERLASEEDVLPIADVEFGFVDEQLILFQIRPFLENKSAQQNEYLLGFDAKLEASANKKVLLSEVPSVTPVIKALKEIIE